MSVHPQAVPGLIAALLGQGVTEGQIVAAVDSVRAIRPGRRLTELARPSSDDEQERIMHFVNAQTDRLEPFAHLPALIVEPKMDHVPPAVAERQHRFYRRLIGWGTES